MIIHIIEVLKAKVAIDKLLSRIDNCWYTYTTSGRIEADWCDYKAAIQHLRNAYDACSDQKRESWGGNSFALVALTFGTTLLKHST